MTTPFFKENLFTRVVVFIVVTNFILTCAPISYANTYTSDSLRIPAAKDRGTARQIGRDLGGVKPDVDPLVLSNNISLREGAQTGGYNIEHAILDGANGGIFNHSERRGRLETAMENMLRSIRALIIEGAPPERIKDNWVNTLKTESLSDKEIEGTLRRLESFVGLRGVLDKGALEEIMQRNARRLVNYIMNVQLKKVIAYSDKYPFAQTVLCVGETLSQYGAMRTQDILKQDLEEILAGITQEQAKNIGLRIAYEPRWAIGTGKTPTAGQIQATHRFIKDTVNRILGRELDVDYGGSLKEDNCTEILALKDVDGGLIGGAAKVAEKISVIIEEAIKQGEIKGKKLNVGMNWKAENVSTGLSPLDAFVELFRTTDLGAVQIAIGTPNVKLVRDRMTELEKEINTQREKGVPKTKVAINGFGRIGKLVLKAFLENPDNRFEIVAVNDLDTIENLAHLFRHDSTFGDFKGEVRVEGDNLIINGQRIKVLSEKDPAKLPWKDLGIGIVIEASGKFTKREGANKHLEAGAEKVVITAPGENEDLSVVLGVNEGKYDPRKHQIISNASCTTNCLAPVVKVLNETFGIKSGSMLTVHAATNDQNVLDTVHKDQRRARATLGNIIPTSTGAAKAIGKVIPELQGKLDGLAMRVPTADVSAVYLDVLLKKDTTVEEVNAALKRAAEEGPLSPYLGYTEETLVSSDFLRSSKSGTVDASVTKVIDKRRAVVVIWYDNEWGYSNRTVQLVNYMLGRTEGLETETIRQIAQALNLDRQGVSNFIEADGIIYRGTAGGAFEDYVEELGGYVQDTQTEQKARALIIAPNFFRIGGAKSALNEIAKLGKNVKIALYGASAQRLKILVGNEDIITGSSLDEVLSELSQLGIASEDAVLLRAPEDKLDREINMRQLVAEKNIPVTLVLAKAIKELLGLLGEATVPAFEEFLSKMGKAEVISPTAYSENKEALLAMLKEGDSFAFSEALRVTEKVAADIEQARKASEEFMDRI